MSKVLYEKRGEVAYITLNRPEAMNAIDLETHQLLRQTWADFRDDSNLRAAIITGAGDEAFCGGADLKTHVPQWLGVPGMHPMGARGKVRDGLGGLTRGMHRIYKPVIAAVNGWALAGGFETALAADIRIASENAKFGSFEVRRGFHHADGGVVRLVNTCGVGFASEMLLTGEPVDAQREPRVEGGAARPAPRRRRGDDGHHPAQRPDRARVGQGDHLRRHRPTARRPAGCGDLVRLRPDGERDDPRPTQELLRQVRQGPGWEERHLPLTRLAPRRGRSNRAVRGHRAAVPFIEAAAGCPRRSS